MYFKLYYRHSGMHTIKVKYVCKVNIVHPSAAVEVLKLLIVFSPCFDFLKYKMMILIHFGIGRNFNKSIYGYISMSFR